MVSSIFRSPVRPLLFVAVLCTHLSAAPCNVGAADYFREHVAPILQAKCLSCHNAVDRQGDFSLHDSKSTFADRLIVRGDPNASHLLALITPENGKAEMPRDGDALSPKEISVITQWIADGARWPDGLTLTEQVIDDFGWWSYQPVASPNVPKMAGGWGKTPIDAFIEAKLSEKGLTPSLPADRRTLIRRVTYDLIGLPPTPKQIDSFVNDTDPRAYKKLVERLLQSKHYGERWARHWLDIVKYADTCGYDKDKLRPNAWPYRDYVIRSLNEDKPYGRFVQEQIAGDVLFPGEPDGILGLGFIAAGPWDFIGHVEVPESKMDGMVARNLDRDDMVSNTINTFCSLTVQCARCHNHKFDPITQDHYYGLQAVFAAVDRADRVYDTDADIEAKRRRLTQQLADARQQLAKLRSRRVSELESEIALQRSELQPNKPQEHGFHSKIEKSNEHEKWVEVDLGESHSISSVSMHACYDDYANIGSGFGFPVRYKVQVTNSPPAVNQSEQRPWKTLVDRTQVDSSNPGLIPVQIQAAGESARFVRVTATKLAERKNDFIFALAELEVRDSEGDNVAAGKAVRSLDSIQAAPRWRRSNLVDQRWPRAGNRDAMLQVVELRRELNELRESDAVKFAQQRNEIEASIKRLAGDLKNLPKGKVVYAAATQFNPRNNFKPTGGKPRVIHVLHRGNIGQQRGVARIGALPLTGEHDWRFAETDDESQRRASLARWLTQDDNPLVWRSIVNRIWQYHMGQGIVATPNDFGRMGARPTHPELLDWMAMDFRDNGQSIKRLHRMIVMSSTYRQSSGDRPANMRIDADNQYLWRMNRRRLSAEEIRDSILSISGTLDLKMGGPGFYLFALEQTQHSPHYEYHKFDPNDPASHRRSIYRFVVRSQPDPWMTTLDCADSSQSTPKRVETLTSLQALSLLNSKFNLAMAKRFAERLKGEHGVLEAQVARAFQLVTQRHLSDQERERLVDYAQRHGLANTCRFLFNLSEFVFVD